MRKEWIIYVGTFSDCLYVMQIHTCSLEVSDLHRVCNPAGKSAFFAVSADQKRLYAANEFQSGEGGVVAFGLEDIRNPFFLNAQSSMGQGPAHISLMNLHGTNYLLGAGYFDGDVTVYPISKQGTLFPISEKICLQEGAHAHAVKPIPGSNYVLATDTEHGEIHTYELIPGGKLLHRHTFAENGFEAPRHMTFSADGAYVYVLTERTSTFDVFSVDKKTGRLCHLQHISTLPDGVGSASRSAAIHMAPNRKFIYCSNRGHDSITVYCVRNDGLADKIGYVKTGIAWPREFAIDPEGECMLVGNQFEKSIGIYRINVASGIPEYTGKKIKLEEAPVCFAFLQMPV